MTKSFVDSMIHNLKLAHMVAKASPWTMEGFGDKQMNVRYVGIKIIDDWGDIFSKKNNLLLKFIIDRKSARIEFYLANKPPFLKFYTTYFSNTDKWETLLGEVKRKLKKDKFDVINHKDSIGNLYSLLTPHLKL